MIVAARTIWDHCLWTLADATFDDGTTLTGSFSTDVYGFVTDWNLSTQADGIFTSYNYTTGGTDYAASGNYFIDFQPGYFGDLHVAFQNDLSIATPTVDPIVTGEASFECQSSYSCFVPMDGATRYLVSGYADSAPEPTAWALMLIGFAGVGYALRRRVAKPAPA